ncbi:Putative prophage phiRv2 integrase [Rhodoplanes serenus]|uniref:Prophage phiRv2 integrase n=1 Tax=Rhodoplanes serenus TaxID=200615 RepID=A0A3S4BXA2_9BRAD|nr:site-specific integrase [Rhodoplanes serenus]VCU09744.1 Putative prophage phiRv2 integrase [Rhodoplanes serenus]
MGEVAGGGDPAVKRKAVIAPTVREVAQSFLEEHVDRKRKSSTAAHYRDCLNRLVLPVLGERCITDVTHAEIADWHGDLEDTPYQANRALAVLSALFSFAEKRDTVAKGSNPCRGVEKFPESSRERYLTSEEISRLGEAMEAIESESKVSPYTLAAIRLLLLTGARRGEILTLKWEYVDFERGMLFLPDSKTGRKSIPLNDLALDLLQSLPRESENSWVIPGRKQDRPLVELKTAWRSVLKRASLKNVRIHDLRHTFASIAAAEGASLLIIGKLLGHRNPQTTQRYAHLASDPLRTAGGLVGANLGVALKGKQQ